MPTALKIIMGIAVLWSTVYSLSYAIFELKQKRPKSGLAAIFTVAAMASVFCLFVL